ncbi:hypothetical protein [Polyangium sp. 15x6]|uniref:hypothetical protein n=1 Tax=Polyangium sp. 15x6 TaxID=3042687 RepID=UPI00249AA226|nr:hypothetical protein [Polyangium sp. 15x6]MDI3292036.1 hypothetical protein [Polyangium sp. 15x6]
MNGFIESGAGHRVGSDEGRGARWALLVGAAMAMGTFGCSSVVSEYDVDANFTVTPKVDGSFFWWNEVTLESDVNSYGAARLGFVRISVAPPAEDITFVDEILGEAVTSTGRTPLVSKSEFPAKESDVILDVLHDGDIRPFFEDGKKVRVEWTGRTNPNFLAWPTDGIDVSVKVRLVLD